MTAQIEVKTDILSQTATRELLYIFKASQFGLVYSLNVMLVFFGAGSIISLLLLNSGDMAIRIIEFYVKIANISDGEYAGRISLAEFFWYGYIFLTLIVYFTQKHHRKRQGRVIIGIKQKIAFIPIIVILLYIPIIYIFSINFGLLSFSTLLFIFFAISAILANYYYLTISSIIKYLDKKLANNR